MKNTRKYFIVFMLFMFLLSGCNNKNTSVEQEQTTMSETIESIPTAETIDNSKITENPTDTSDISTTMESDIILNNTYTTRFEEINAVTYPVFVFDYPDNWTVTDEEVTISSEKVTLTSNTGVTIVYWHFGNMRDLKGAVRTINKVDITHMADSNFTPSYVQATDYSDLGKFMVAKIKVTAECDMLGDGEFHEVNSGRVRYALLPESELETQDEYLRSGLPTFSFWYGGHISMIAHTPNMVFTEQEEKEIIAILSSFREESF